MIPLDEFPHRSVDLGHKVLDDTLRVSLHRLEGVSIPPMKCLFVALWLRDEIRSFGVVCDFGRLCYRCVVV